MTKAYYKINKVSMTIECLIPIDDMSIDQYSIYYPNHIFKVLANFDYNYISYLNDENFIHNNNGEDPTWAWRDGRKAIVDNTILYRIQKEKINNVRNIDYNIVNLSLNREDEIQPLSFDAERTIGKIYIIKEIKESLILDTDYIKIFLDSGTSITEHKLNKIDLQNILTLIVSKIKTTRNNLTL